MDIDNHIPIANYIFVTITAGVLAYVTAMSENVDETDEMPPEYADNQEDSYISDDIQPADDNNENKNENENEGDNNNSFVSSFGAATTGFFAGLGATNKEEKEEEEKEEKDDSIESTADDIPSLDTKQLEDGTEIQPSQDSPDISELKDSELGQPSIEPQATVKPDSIAELDSNVKDNDDSLNVIKKEPINGGTKSTRRHTKSKKLNKSKRTKN